MSANIISKHDNSERSTATASNKTMMSEDEKLQQYSDIAETDEWKEQFQRYPSTGDGYMVAFDPDAPETWRGVMQKYGFCVFANVIEKEQCVRSVAAMQAEINADAPHQAEPIDFKRPRSWEKKNWPSKMKFLVRKPALATEAFQNRLSPKIAAIYQELHQTQQLWSSVDNWGVMRGTVKLKGLLDGRTERTDWRYELAPHWDINPWFYTERAAEGAARWYQGIVALDNCPEAVGGFCAVPGSANYLPQWCEFHRRPDQSTRSIRPKANDPLNNLMQRIPLRRGEMVVFDGATLHCNFANHSPKVRLIQFIRQVPRQESNLATKPDKYCAHRILRQHELTADTTRYLKDLSKTDRALFGMH